MDLWRTPGQVRGTSVDGDHGQIHLRENQARQLHGLPLICLHPVPVSGRIFARLLGALEDRRFAMAPICLAMACQINRLRRRLFRIMPTPWGHYWIHSSTVP